MGGKVLCPQCGHDETKVTDSRSDGNERIRKRRCVHCGHGFATVERVSVEGLYVKKRDGRVEPFSRTKLTQGITRAVGIGSLTTADINAFVERVTHSLQPTASGVPIPSVEIGKLVLQELHDSNAITDVARIRYAIVFLGTTTRAHSFHGLRDFLDWLDHAYGPRDVETPVDTPNRVIKCSGISEPFQLMKLEKSVAIAAKGRDKQDRVHTVASQVALVAKEALSGQAIVTSGQIAAEVLRALRSRDSMIYLRYASAVKGYRAVEDFWLDAIGLENN
jgi:transcriptional repressor NrdR